MEINKDSSFLNAMRSNPTIAAAIFVAATPVYPMIMGIRNANTSKLKKKLHYLTSLKKKSAYHTKHINGIQSILILLPVLKKVMDIGTVYDNVVTRYIINNDIHGVYTWIVKSIKEYKER